MTCGPRAELRPALCRLELTRWRERASSVDGKPGNSISTVAAKRHVQNRTANELGHTQSPTMAARAPLGALDANAAPRAQKAAEAAPDKKAARPAAAR